MSARLDARLRRLEASTSDPDEGPGEGLSALLAYAIRLRVEDAALEEEGSLAQLLRDARQWQTEQLWVG